MSDEDFETLMAREWGPILAVATALVGRRAVAEELTQEAFFAAHRSWSTVGLHDRPGAWVRRAVINASISQLRRRRVELRVLGVLGRDPGRRVVADDPQHGRPTAALDSVLWSEVRRLPTRQAQCIVLRHVDGLGTDEIAAVLGCAPATVRVHLHRGLSTLRSRLATEDPVRAADASDDVVANRWIET